MIKHSYTRLSNYIRCPKAYEFQYIQKLPAPKSGPALLGGVCHDFFEAYDRHLMATRQATDHAAAERILLEVFHNFERPVPPELYDDYLEICRGFVQEHVLDYANIFGAEVQIAVTRALLICGWDDPAAWFRFKLDRVDLIRETGRVVITDYKTGWGGGADPFQLLLYACAVWLLHAQGKLRRDFELKAVEVVLYYNRSGREVRWIFTPEQIQRGIDQMVAYAERVEADKEFKPTPGPACLSCDYAGVCPARAQHLAPLLTLEQATNAAAEAMLLKAQADAREEVLRRWVQENGPVPVRGSEYKFSTRESYKVLDPVGFVKAVQAAGADPLEFYEIATSKLKRRCQKDAGLADHVAPYIAVETKEIFGHKPAPKLDPFASSKTTQGEPNEQTVSPAAVESALNLQSPLAGPARLRGAGGPQAGSGPPDRDPGPGRHDHGPARRGPARLPRPGLPPVGEQPANPGGERPGGRRRRSF
jgi:putative RecB family exonuclease